MALQQFHPRSQAAERPHRRRAEVASSGLTEKRARQATRRPPPPFVPDERPLWALIHATRYLEAEHLLARDQARAPRWHPNSDLLRTLHEGETRAAIARSIAAHDPAALIALATRSPAFFDAAHLASRWALAQAYHDAKRPQDAYALLHDTLYAGLKPADLAATLQKAASWLSPADYDRLLRSGLQELHGKPPEESIARVYADVRFAQLLAAFRAGDDGADRRAIDDLLPFVTARRDATRSLTIGWVEHHLGRLPVALEWFQRAAAWAPSSPEARYAEAIALTELKRFREAEPIATALPPTLLKRAELLATVHRGLSDDAFKAKRFKEALALLDQAEREGDRSFDLRLQRAWTTYQLGRAVEAARQFTVLYRERPTPETANGLFVSSERAGHLDSLAGFLSDPVLRKLYTEAQARLDFGAKRYGLAFAEAPHLFPNLAGLEDPDLAAGANVDDRSGSEGLSHLTVWTAPLLGGRWTLSHHDRFIVNVDQVILTNGTLAPNAAIGTAPANPTPYGAAPPSNWSGVRPQLTWSRSATTSYVVVLGATPTGGALPILPTAEVSLSTEAPLGRVGLTGYALPVTESALSYVGIRDPYRGTAWGRVQRYGTHLDQTFLLDRTDSLTFRELGEGLAGSGVQGNLHVGLQANVQHSLGIETLDYAAWGLEAGYDGYQRNLSGFTLGQGGYYSPQVAGRLKLMLDINSRELEPWIWSLHAGTGPSYDQGDPSPTFPLTPDGTTTPGYTHLGWDVEARAQAAVRLTPWLQAGAGLTYDHNQFFDRRAASLFVRGVIGRRTVVTTGDLD
jgi:tetratricopeptide (TPR) repeat protein